LGPQAKPWSDANINTFLFFTGLGALVGINRWFRQPYLWMVLLPLVGLLGFAYGVVPNSICQQIPFIGAIHHIAHTFFTAAIVFAVLLSGFGVASLLADLKQDQGQVKWLVYVLFVLVLLVWWAYPYYGHDEEAISIAGGLAFLSIGGTALLLFTAIWFYRYPSGYSKITCVFLITQFLFVHFYHGFHPKTGVEDLDNLIINPTPRADLLELSPAISSLGYLLGANDVEKRAGIGKTIIDTARQNGSDIALVQEYTNVLKDAIQRSKNSAEIRYHAAKFLRGVGAKQWLDNPVRVIGIGRAPMSGFYSFLGLESLNGPDALMSSRYMEFLDSFGWRLKSNGVWLRTMNVKDVHNYKSLLDVLNVGYVLSRKQDVNIRHLVSDFVHFQTGLSENHQNNVSGVSALQIRQVMGLKIDRVSCNSTKKGLQNDGRADNVFVVDIRLPDIGPEARGSITAIRLERSTPTGVNHTGGRNYVLGVSQEKNSSFLNTENGAIDIKVSDSHYRFWVFSCADGYDMGDSQYRARLAYAMENRIPLVLDLDMKVWERDSSWPRAFFVDQVARYQQPRDLASFIQQSDGLPLAAVQAENLVEPRADRNVVFASKYELTNNSTGFTLTAPGPGLVVLTEVNIPGDIHVDVNGVPKDVITVNHAFRGLWLDKSGTYEIRFYYRPRFWTTSLLGSVAGVCLIVFVFIGKRFWVRN
jgi:hypothetical protein